MNDSIPKAEIVVPQPPAQAPTQAPAQTKTWGVEQNKKRAVEKLASSVKYLLIVIGICIFSLGVLGLGVYREYYDVENGNLALLSLALAIFADLYIYLNWHMLRDDIEVFDPIRQGAFMVEAVDLDGTRTFEVKSHFMFALFLGTGSVAGALFFSARSITVNTPGAYNFLVVVVLIVAVTFQAIFCYFIYILNDIIKGREEKNMCPTLV